MKNFKSVFATIIICLSIFYSSTIEANPIARIGVREFLENLARKETGKVISKGALDVAETTIQKYGKTYGLEKMMEITTHGGLDIFEAFARHGDDVFKYAAKVSPKGCKALASNADTLLPLAKKIGPEVIELEAKAPGLSNKIFQAFGEQGVRDIATHVPAKDITKLLHFGEMADSKATRELLLDLYKKNGPSIFQKIPPGAILATGAAGGMLIISGGIATTIITSVGPGIGDSVGPDTPARVINNAAYVAGAVVLLVALLWVYLRFVLNKIKILNNKELNKKPEEKPEQFK